MHSYDIRIPHLKLHNKSMIIFYPVRPPNRKDPSEHSIAHHTSDIFNFQLLLTSSYIFTKSFLPRPSVHEELGLHRRFAPDGVRNSCCPSTRCVVNNGYGYILAGMFIGISNTGFRSRGLYLLYAIRQIIK